MSIQSGPNNLAIVAFKTPAFHKVV